MKLKSMLIPSYRGSYKVKFSQYVAQLSDLGLQLEHSFFIVDQNVLRIYQKQFKQLIPSNRIISFEACEANKSMKATMQLARALLRRGVKRGDHLVAVGGGITLDISGFVASILLRGVPWISIPTTLLAQADSCIGGKTGVNLDGFKNQLGSIYPPQGVIVVKEFLYSLPDADIFSGLGEILKANLLSGPSRYKHADILSKKIRSELLKTIEHDVRYSLLVKKEYIKNDEWEMNQRIILNYGHTFGHAIEALSAYSMPHGQSVAIGMDISNFLSMHIGLMSETTYLRLSEILNRIYDRKSLIKLRASNLLSKVRRDKKSISTGVRMILLNQKGQPIVKEFNDFRLLQKLVSKYLSETR